MRWEGLISACAVGLLVATVGAAERDALPEPWFRTGTAMPVDKCKTSVGGVTGRSFDTSIVIRCEGLSGGFATVMQEIAADDYRGRRVRLFAQVRGDRIEDWAGLWMRVDGEGAKVLAFDNMQRRPFTGTFDWRPASVVLEVPADATKVAFGILQNGNGGTFVGAISLDQVGNDVATTNVKSELPRAPGNLSLKK